MVDLFQERLKAGVPSLGLMVQEPNMVELAAHIGWDWFIIDQMFTGNDWGQTEYLIRTGEAAGIAPFVRVQAEPWLGEDPRMAVDVARALGIGAKYVLVSHAGYGDIERCAPLSRDWHRKPIHLHPFNSIEEWESRTKEMGEQTYVIPHAESRGALDTIEQTLKHPDVKAFFFATSDATRVLAGNAAPDWYDPRLWELIDQAVEIGERENVVIGANTSYAYDMDEQARRIEKLAEHGIKFIMVQTAPFLFQISIGKFLREARAALGIN